MSAMNTRLLIQALPQYGELIARLGMHINMSQKINTELHKRKLNEIGMLEQVRGQAAGLDSCPAAATVAGRCHPVHAQGPGRVDCWKLALPRAWSRAAAFPLVPPHAA
jgi:hypothetical protein